MKPHQKQNLPKDDPEVVPRPDLESDGDIVLNEGKSLDDEQIQLLDGIEDKLNCVRCDADLEEGHGLFLSARVMIDSIPGGAGKLVKLPICAECRSFVKAVKFSEYGASLRDLQDSIEKMTDSETACQMKTAMEESVYEYQKRYDQPWRDKGRSKRDRRHHR